MKWLWTKQNDAIMMLSAVFGKTHLLKLFFYQATLIIRNLIRDSRVVPGGGAAEIAASIAVDAMAESIPGVQQYAVRAFAEALLAIPEALADNSGLDAITTVAAARAAQLKQSNSMIGVDCMSEEDSVNDMLAQNVWESLLSKRNQFSLATQVSI